MKTTSIFLITTVIALIAGAVGSFASMTLVQPGRNALIRDFYATENAVHVSPHSLRKKIENNDHSFILVDLRSAQEYEKEHIVGAVNIPAYSDPDTSAYGDVERIVAAFRALPKDQNIVVYCYSMPCMTGRKIGLMLTEHDIYVQHLGIGWNEWRFFWQLWNHEHEWAKTKVEDYVTNGKEPGSFQGTPSITPCIEGQFGC